MNITNIPFNVINWTDIDSVEYRGITGTAMWRTKIFGDIRIRMLEYSPGYSADHWCSKGHIILCIEGELITQLSDGRKFILTPGMSYQVSDNSEAHRSSTINGAKLFVVD
jgi:quercetin dioxygenase-like cupin family protein